MAGCPGLKRCPGQLDTGASPCQVRTARHTVRRDYLGKHALALRCAACPAYPSCTTGRGPRKRCPGYHGHSLHGACGHRPSSARLQDTSRQAPRWTAPARRSRQATGPRLKLYRGFGQTAFLPNWPWGRSSHVPCSPGDSNRLESPARIPCKWRLIMAHSHVPYTPGQPASELLRLPCPRSPAFPSLMLPHLASASHGFLTLPSAAPS